MSFKKFKGKAVFTGTEMLAENAVLITDEDGQIQNIIDEREAGLEIQQLDGILCPGFVNTHCHLELSHMKGVIPQQTGMVPFLIQVMTTRFGNAENMQAAIAAAEAEMWQNGIVAVGDICNTADSLSVKQLQRLYYHNFVEVSGFIPAGAANRLAAAQQVADVFKSAFSAKQVSITPHAPYSVSNELFRLINALPDNHLLSIHNQESAAENLFFNKKDGDFLKLFERIGVDLSFFEPPARNSLPAVCSSMNFPEKNWLLVHNCFTTLQDIEESCLPKNNVSFCLCPRANLYIGNPLPNVITLQQSGQNICLGTDSLASNTQLSILQEMVLLQNAVPQLSISQLLQWATLNGAKALQIDDQFGSFEKGKKPGVILLQQFDTNKLNADTTVKRII